MIPSVVVELETNDCSALLAQLLSNNLLVFEGDSRDIKEVEIKIIEKYFLRIGLISGFIFGEETGFQILKLIEKSRTLFF